MTMLYLWIFTSKWIKLLGHYLRYPVDVFLLPVSIIFGYLHGAIKMYAVMTLNVVCLILFNSPFIFHFPPPPIFGFFSYFFPIFSLSAYECIQAQPSSYDNSASQRFDHLACSVYPLFSYFPVDRASAFLI